MCYLFTCQLCPLAGKNTCSHEFVYGVLALFQVCVQSLDFYLLPQGAPDTVDPTMWVMKSITVVRRMEEALSLVRRMGDGQGHSAQVSSHLCPPAVHVTKYCPDFVGKSIIFLSACQQTCFEISKQVLRKLNLIHFVIKICLGICLVLSIKSLCLSGKHCLLFSFSGRVSQPRHQQCCGQRLHGTLLPWDAG